MNPDQIRDLEARVEILSGTKEEAHSHTRAIIQGLMEENARLRSLVRDLGSFMADGLGGPLLDRTGWTMQQFKDFINRADSDTAYESFIKAKAQANTGASSASGGGRGAGAGPSAVMSISQSTPEGDTSRKRKRESLPADSTAEATSGPPSSMRRVYSVGRNAHRASSPSELPSLLPSGQTFRSEQDMAGPSSFSSLVDTLNSSVSAPFVELGRGPITTPHRSASGPAPTSAGYSQDDGFTMHFNGSTGPCQAPYRMKLSLLPVHSP